MNLILTRKTFFVIPCIVFIVIGGYAALRLTDVSHRQSLPIRQTSKISPSPVPSASGLRITRDFVITSIQKISPDITFSPSLPVDGAENYTAQKDQNTIALIGPESNLTEISSTAVLGGDINRNKQALLYLVAIPTFIDPEAGSWISSVMNDAENRKETSVNISTTIHQKKYSFSLTYNDLLKLFSIKIDSSQ